jgi:hypothetical protein
MLKEYEKETGDADKHREGNRHDFVYIQWSNQITWACKCPRIHTLITNRCYGCDMHKPKKQQPHIYLEIVAGRVVTSGKV